MIFCLALLLRMDVLKEIEMGKKVIMKNATLYSMVIGILTAVPIVLIQGCTVGKDYKSPQVQMPEQWQESSDVFAVVHDPNLAGWWTIFTDDCLNGLIMQAIENNQDIKAAMHRVDASRALRDYTAGQYYPNVDATGSYSRTQISKDGAVQSETASDPFDLHSAGVDVLWEIDLFGKIKRSIESSEASYQASIEDYRNVMVVLLAEVCRNYIDLRTTQTQIVYALDNIEIQRRTMMLVQKRYESEIVGELDVRQAEVNLANTESAVPLLHIVESAAMNRLAVLLGQMPGTLKDQLSEHKQLPVVQMTPAIGIPADLLRQRPDIRRAERQLAAQTALIGVATADLYPSLQLSGTFEIQSRQLSGLGNIHNQAYSFGPGLRWNLFDANRIKNIIRIEEAGAQELLAKWENAVLSAAEEVQNAMTAYGQQLHRRVLLDDSVKSSRRSVELVENLYTNGLVDFQNVLDSQRTLFLQQEKLAESEGSALQALILFYKSCGGGWQAGTFQCNSR
jgi:NodT family efflux transporter outer membrane factor (OMF) lipoprotein